MPNAVAPWRVTYTPGNWLVLSGPTSVVVMIPAPARMSALVNRLWTDMVSAGSLDALLDLLAQYGFDAMPDLAAFFWDDEGLHGIARGRVAVVDTEVGEVAFDGAGVKTWREVSLGEERQLRIDMEPVDQDAVLQLPLVVGSATASAIYLNTSADARLYFPDRESLGTALEVAPEPAPYIDAEVIDEPEAERHQEPAAVLAPRTMPQLGSPNEELTPEAPVAETSAPGVEPEVSPAPDPVAETAPPEDEPEVSPTPEPVAAPSAPAAADTDVPVPPPSPAATDIPTGGEPEADAFGTGSLDFDTGELHAATDEQPEAQPTAEPAPSADPEPAATEPVAQPSASGERDDPVVVPGRFAQEPEPQDEGTVFSDNIAATHKPSAEPEQEQQVLTVWCPNRHPNAPGSVQCRICRGPVDSSNPRLTRRPLLAGVNTNYGEFADVVDGVLVGRAPDPSKAPTGSYLMRVTSPSSDISRSHLVVTTQGWNVMVTDLHSTNGTTVMPVGEQPFVLANGQSVQVELGTILDLGDGVSLRIEPPRG